MRSPLPPEHAELLATSGTNPSLVFFRGFDRYADDFAGSPAGERGAFLQEFLGRFANADPTPYRSFVERRTAALEQAGATRLDLASTQPLVLGLGLPHPTETALLLDRLTGCPYVPGSSLKGVLRRAARLAAAGELAVDGHPEAPSYWQQNLDPLFGPPIGEGKTPATGRAVFYDAFPTAWPALALDVLTPHHGGYYADPSQPPGDWEEPIPIPFLTLMRNTRLRFAFGPRRTRSLADEEVAALRHLLLAALDWLGVGGKTASQGYGTFTPAGSAAKVTVVSPPTSPPPPPQGPRAPGFREPKAPPPPKIKGKTVWKDHELTIEQGKATIWHGRKDRAQCPLSDLPKDLQKALKKKRSLRVDADIGPGLGDARRILEVRLVEDDA